MFGHVRGDEALGFISIVFFLFLLNNVYLPSIRIDIGMEENFVCSQSKNDPLIILNIFSNIIFIYFIFI